MLLLNNEPVQLTIFPNGETKVHAESLNPHVGNNEIELKFESDADLIHLMFVKDYIDSLGVRSYLKMSYIPYSRMDRQEGQSVFTLKSFARLINSLNFVKVMVFEAHSDVSLALIDRVESSMIPTSGMLDRVKHMVGFEDKKDFIYFPDAGAEKRYHKNILGRYLFGIKHRNFENGDILSLEVEGKTTEHDEFNRIIMVDDLCSKGGTFLFGAEELKKKYGFKEIYLLVGHTENTILEGNLINSDLVDKIFTTDSIFTGSHEKIVII